MLGREDGAHEQDATQAPETDDTSEGKCQWTRR